MIIEYRPANEPKLPANFSVAHAQLPAAYEHAKTALAECASLDECQGWADKAAALASYARQAEDDTLERHAQRIRARAIRRAGELLKQIEPQKGGDRKSNEYQKVGTGPLISRKEAGAQAGMSERQVKTAIQVANVPAAEFDKQVESSTPPTVTTLAEQGTVKRTTAAAEPAVSVIPEVSNMIAGSGLDTDVYISRIAKLPPNDQVKAAKRDLAQHRKQQAEKRPTVPEIVRPVGFAETTELLGTVEMFAEFCRAQNPEIIAAAVMSHESQEVREHVATIDGWLDRFVVNLKG